MDQETGPQDMSPRTLLYIKDTCRLKRKDWRKTYHINTNEKKAGLPALISDRADFRAKKVIRNTEGGKLLGIS